MLPASSTLYVHVGVTPPVLEHAPAATTAAETAPAKIVARSLAAEGVGMGLLLLDRERDRDVHGDAPARGRGEGLPAEAAQHARGDLVRVDRVVGQRGAADLPARADLHAHRHATGDLARPQRALVAPLGRLGPGAERGLEGGRRLA